MGLFAPIASFFSGVLSSFDANGVSVRLGAIQLMSVVALVIAPSIANDAAVADYNQQKEGEKQAIELVIPAETVSQETEAIEAEDQTVSFKDELEKTIQIITAVEKKSDC